MNPHREDRAARQIGVIGLQRAARRDRAVDPDRAQTSFENGVLVLTLPKTADAKPKQIKVGTTNQLGSGRTG
jgi:HSP20 family molecular chaperone IbpA